MDMDWTLQPGTILLEKYRVESVLGRGGMGIVLRVTHLHLSEELALKILSPEAAAAPDVTTRFVREAQSVVRLRGEHVTRVSDVGILPGGGPYMVMEYLRGVDLAGEINRRKTLLPGDAVDYVLQACEALAEAHANGIVHRDIKPANLFLTTRPDGTSLIKVLDFGISKTPVTASHLLTKTETVMGTPGYMSPEQMKATKDVDARTDIWALGTVLYECLSGRRPFEGESFSAVVLMAGTEPPPPMEPRIPRGLQDVVLRCLEKDRRARFPSIAELATALAPFARDQRAAAVIVDRTSLMLQGTHSEVDLAARSGPLPMITTLSGSAGAARSMSRRRYALVGGMSLLGSIAISAVVTMVATGHPRNAQDGAVIRQGASVAGPSADDRVAAARPPAGADVRSPSTTILDAAASPINDNNVDKAQKVSICTELFVQRDWRALGDCASELDALGLKDEARPFHAVAKQESGNEVQARNIQQALRDGNLKQALTLLRTIDDASVYYATSGDAFTKAEALAFNDAKQKAQGLANTHNCAELKNFVAHLVAVSSDRVAGAAQAVACVDRTPPAKPSAVKDATRLPW